MKEAQTHHLIDLLSERCGGRALSCSDQWFAQCSNLVKPGRGVFKEGHFVETGQWMDGWESRRSFGRSSRVDGVDYDWSILRMGVPGTISYFEVDTNHFKGNAPDFISIEGAQLEQDPDETTEWTEVIQKSPTEPHAINRFQCDSQQAWTHLRLNIYPDGGVARFRAYGIAKINPKRYAEGELIDLASVVNGGRGIAASDMFYSAPSNLVMPDRGINMGDGWETKRRRDNGHDWAIVSLGIPGSIQKVIIDTAHFKGNYPDHFSLEAANSCDEKITESSISWIPIIANTPLNPDKEHIFVQQLLNDKQHLFTHVRLNIYPDGGVSRLRIIGTPDWSTL